MPKQISLDPTRSGYRVQTLVVRIRNFFTSFFLVIVLSGASVNAQTTGDYNDNFILNLADTDILALITAVSKSTGRNFVVDPSVQGRVRVISTAPIDSDEFYEIFLSVLQVHGYSAVSVGRLTKIIPNDIARTSPVPVVSTSDQATDHLVSRVISVAHVPSDQLANILRPMIDINGQLESNSATNSILITDREANVQRLSEIIDLMDKPDNDEIEVVEVKHSSAAEIIKTLSPLQRVSIDGTSNPSTMQLLADERTNSVLVSGNQAVRNRVRNLINKLDSAIESNGNTKVVFLRFAKAEDLAKVLKGSPIAGSTVSDPSGGSKLLGISNENSLNDNFDSDLPQSQLVIPDTNISARQTETAIDVRVDTNTNSLIITGPPEFIRSSLAIIEQLDIRRPQVMVEVVIAEITEDNTRELGINFLLNRGTNETLGFSNLGGESVLTGPTGTSADTLPTSIGSGLTLALGSLSNSNLDFGLLIRAISSNAANNIISTPTIVTLDNQEAEIVVGSTVPLLTGQQLSDNNDNPFQTIERSDIGLTLKVKPQISDGDTIKLELEQEVSNVNTTSFTGAADITTSKRSIKTTVLIEDGQTMVLGGLIDDQINDVVEKVPLLGDVPVVGRLFKFKSTQKIKKNMVIFLRPIIMRDNLTTSTISNKRYDDTRHRITDNQKQLRNGLKKPPTRLPGINLVLNSDTVNNRTQNKTIAKAAVAEDYSTKLPVDNDGWTEMPDGSRVLQF